MWKMPIPEITSTKLSKPNPNRASVSSLKPKKTENNPSAMLYRIVMMLSNKANETKESNDFESLELIISGSFAIILFVEY
jgi:hypothetical protein